MDNMEMNNAEWYREQGKILFSDNGGDMEKRAEGIKYLLYAYKLGDAEASYIVANLMLRGIIVPKNAEGEEEALGILCRLADNGDIASRKLLNSICYLKYEESGFEKAQRPDGMGLIDFDGKPIKISEKGLLTPIDAELKCTDGKNVLELSANAVFIYTEDIPEPERFEKAVIDGFNLWAGEYTVFGGQPVTVKMNITTDRRIFDNIFVVPLTPDIGENVKKITDTIGTKERKEQMEGILRDKRSFATAGFKWSVRSRKMIYIQSEDGSFTDYGEIRDVAKHEFGHALGLGDLYYSPTDALYGVEKGTYRELDSFYVSDKSYNLVMCDHHGPVSNNDIEMILLAFRDNEAQLYQSSKFKGRISQALGKGN